MYKKILIPVDMAQADKASEMIKIGVALSGDESEYILVNIVPSVPFSTEMSIPTQVLKTASDDAKAKLKTIAGNEGIKAKVVVRVGHAAQDILAIAEENSADLIIVGSHRPGLQDYLLGSTASRVVRHAQCPVFILR